MNPLTIAIVLQVLELVTFPMAVAVYGIHGESNPMMGLVYGIAGMFGVILLKASAIVVAYLTAIRLPYKRNLKTIAISAIGVMGFLGTATHLLTVWMYG